MIRTYEILRIVKGNEYPIKVFLEQMGYSNRRLMGTAVDLRQVSDLEVHAVSALGFKSVALEPVVSSDGTYATVVVPDSAQMRLGPWGIRLTGVLNGRKIASAERHVFDLVQWNGQSYIPPLQVDGEGSYMLNMRFIPVDIDMSGDYGQMPGWIGFATFEEHAVSEIDLSGLTPVPNVRGSHHASNEVEGARLVVVASTDSTLSFSFGGIVTDLDFDDYDGYRYYYTDPQAVATLDFVAS